MFIFYLCPPHVHVASVIFLLDTSRTLGTAHTLFLGACLLPSYGDKSVANNERVAT